MTLFFTNSEQILPCGEGWDDELLGEPASGRDGIAAGTSEVIAVSADDLLDQPEVTQAFEIAGDAGDRQMGQEWLQVSASYPTDVELRMLQSAQQIMLGLVEEIKALDAVTIDLFGRGQFVQEMHHLRSFDRDNRFSRDGCVEALHGRVRTEDPIGRAPDLHRSPVLGLTEDVEDWAASPSVTIKKPVQHVRRQTIGQLLGAGPGG